MALWWRTLGRGSIAYRAWHMANLRLRASARGGPAHHGPMALHLPQISVLSDRPAVQHAEPVTWAVLTVAVKTSRAVEGGSESQQIESAARGEPLAPEGSDLR